MTLTDAFRALGLDDSATWDQVKTRYKEEVQAWHPDRFPADTTIHQCAQEKMKQLNAARDLLREQFRRDEDAEESMAGDHPLRESGTDAPDISILDKFFEGVLLAIFFVAVTFVKHWRGLVPGGRVAVQEKLLHWLSWLAGILLSAGRLLLWGVICCGIGAAAFAAVAAWQTQESSRKSEYEDCARQFATAVKWTLLAAAGLFLLNGLPW